MMHACRVWTVHFDDSINQSINQSINISLLKLDRTQAIE